jgi:hypothetical protein
MAFDLLNFMDGLAAFIAAETELNYATLTAPRSLWRNQAIDDGVQCTPAFSVLRCYGGKLDWVPLATPSIQVETIGKNDAALAQASAIFGALTDSDGRALRNVEVSSTMTAANFRINGILNLGIPALLSRDDQGRARVTFNFDAEALALSA